MNDESLEEFEKEAIPYLNGLGRRHLNIVNNILTIVKTAHDKKLCTYLQYTEMLRLVISIKWKLLNKGRVTPIDMKVLNDITITYKEYL